MTSLLKVIYYKWRFRLKYWKSPMRLPRLEQYRGKKKCLVMLAADYGNLGDVAITYAQEKFLREQLPGYEIVDVPISSTLLDLNAWRDVCTTDDIITVVGGGNMTDLYFDIELLRQMAVEAFPNNRVILFPQTMFFSETPAGRYMRKRAKKVYSGHNNLTISSREQLSFQAMKEMIPSSLFMPDIVMTLDEREPAVERKGITLCLRQDKESKVTDDFKSELEEELLKNHKLTHYDTHIGRDRLTLKAREEELHKIWSQFRSSEWVVTDRLHGMIFAFITGTPCIVLPNNNYKIEGCYSWIKECGYIHYIDNHTSIDDVINMIGKPITSNFEEVSTRIHSEFSKLLMASH